MVGDMEIEKPSARKVAPLLKNYGVKCSTAWDGKVWVTWEHSPSSLAEIHTVRKFLDSQGFELAPIEGYDETIVITGKVSES